MADAADITDPERTLAVAYARPDARDGLSAVFALDERLAGILARTSEPAIGLMRLVWWRDALLALEGGPPPAEPLLIAIASLRLDGAALAGMTEGWEALIDDPELAPETIDLHGRERGARLFGVAGTLLGAQPAEGDRIAAMGELWARADLARHLSSAEHAARVLASAGPWLHRADGPVRRALRPLGMLARLAAQDVARGVARRHVPASRRRLLRIFAHQLTGR